METLYPNTTYGLLKHISARGQVLTLSGAPLQICSGFIGRLAGVCCAGDKLWVEDFYLDEVISLNLTTPALRWKEQPVDVM